MGGSHVMSHNPYLLSDLNLIQIKDKKERNQVSWESIVGIKYPFLFHFEKIGWHKKDLISFLCHHKIGMDFLDAISFVA